MKVYKKAYIKISFILILGFTLGSTLANNIQSTAYTSKEKCEQNRKENNKLYPNYTRSNCYENNGYYYYNICDKGENCKADNVGEVKSMSGTNENEFGSCSINMDKYPIIKGNLKNKLDGILSRLSKKFGGNNKIKEGLIYGFYDYTLGKLKGLSKYKNNKTIQQVVGYLQDKLRCVANKDVGKEDEIDEFLGEVFGGNDTDKKKREEGMKSFIIFMREKGVKKDVIDGYVKGYNLLSENDKKYMLGTLDKIYENNTTNNNTNTNQNTGQNGTQHSQNQQNSSNNVITTKGTNNSIRTITNPNKTLLNDGKIHSVPYFDKDTHVFIQFTSNPETVVKYKDKERCVFPYKTKSITLNELGYKYSQILTGKLLAGTGAIINQVFECTNKGRRLINYNKTCESNYKLTYRTRPLPFPHYVLPKDPTKGELEKSKLVDYYCIDINSCIWNLSGKESGLQPIINNGDTIYDPRNGGHKYKCQNGKFIPYSGNTKYCINKDNTSINLCSNISKKTKADEEYQKFLGDTKNTSVNTSTNNTNYSNNTNKNAITNINGGLVNPNPANYKILKNGNTQTLVRKSDGACYYGPVNDISKGKWIQIGSIYTGYTKDYNSHTLFTVYTCTKDKGFIINNVIKCKPGYEKVRYHAGVAEMFSKSGTKFYECSKVGTTCSYNGEKWGNNTTPAGHNVYYRKCSLNNDNTRYIVVGGRIGINCKNGKLYTNYKINYIKWDYNENKKVMDKTIGRIKTNGTSLYTNFDPCKIVLQKEKTLNTGNGTNNVGTIESTNNNKSIINTNSNFNSNTSSINVNSNKKIADYTRTDSNKRCYSSSKNKWYNNGDLDWIKWGSISSYYYIKSKCENGKWVNLGEKKLDTKVAKLVWIMPGQSVLDNHHEPYQIATSKVTKTCNINGKLRKGGQNGILIGQWKSNYAYGNGIYQFADCSLNGNISYRRVYRNNGKEIWHNGKYSTNNNITKSNTIENNKSCTHTTNSWFPISLKNNESKVSYYIPWHAFFNLKCINGKFVYLKPPFVRCSFGYHPSSKNKYMCVK